VFRRASAAVVAVRANGMICPTMSFSNDQSMMPHDGHASTSHLLPTSFDLGTGASPFKHPGNVNYACPTTRKVRELSDPSSHCGRLRRRTRRRVGGPEAAIRHGTLEPNGRGDEITVRNRSEHLPILRLRADVSTWSVPGAHELLLGAAANHRSSRALQGGSHDDVWVGHVGAVYRGRNICNGASFLDPARKIRAIAVALWFCRNPSGVLG
jgi:hypothetical protein